MADKAYFRVVAGVVPSIVEKEHTKMWVYTSEDYEFDITTKLKDGVPTRFEEMMMEATLYAQSITDPRYLNWVKMEWMWL